MIFDFRIMILDLLVMNRLRCFSGMLVFLVLSLYTSAQDKYKLHYFFTDKDTTFNAETAGLQTEFVNEFSCHLHWLERRHPFTTAHLQDDDLSVDFALHTTPSDRVAIVVTEPLTEGEAWQAFAPGELKVFVHGADRSQGGASGDPQASAAFGSAAKL